MPKHIYIKVQGKRRAAAHFLLSSSSIRYKTKYFILKGFLQNVVHINLKTRSEVLLVNITLPIIKYFPEVDTLAHGFSPASKLEAQHLTVKQIEQFLNQVLE